MSCNGDLLIFHQSKVTLQALTLRVLARYMPKHQWPMVKKCFFFRKFRSKISGDFSSISTRSSKLQKKKYFSGFLRKVATIGLRSLLWKCLKSILFAAISLAKTVQLLTSIIEILSSHCSYKSRKVLELQSS